MALLLWLVCIVLTVTGVWGIPWPRRWYRWPVSVSVVALGIVFWHYRGARANIDPENQVAVQVVTEQLSKRQAVELSMIFKNHGALDVSSSTIEWVSTKFRRPSSGAEFMRREAEIERGLKSGRTPVQILGPIEATQPRQWSMRNEMTPAELEDYASGRLVVMFAGRITYEDWWFWPWTTYFCRGVANDMVQESEQIQCNSLNSKHPW